MEELKHDDYFYEVLNPEYQWMLAYKVDGEHLAGYCNLLLAAQKLERWAEARDPLSPKTVGTSGSNMTCFQTPVNLFPSHKLKGNCTFTAWAVTIGNDEVVEDSSPKQEGGEMEPSADNDLKASGRAWGTDQSVEYIIDFTKAIELYQKKRNCFGCGSPDHLV